MPKILRIINRFNIGGPTYNATFLSSELNDDFETLLIGGLPEKNEADSLHIPEKYNVKPLLLKELKRTPSFNNDRIAYKKIIEIIKDFKPDIVHTHASKAGALGRKAAKKCGVPIIIHTFHGHVFHSYFGKLKTFLVKLIERRLSNISTVIITISEKQKEEICTTYRICKHEKAVVIPLGFDLTQFKRNVETRKVVQNEFEINPKIPALAIIGRLAPVKNHVFFLDVIQEVCMLTKHPFQLYIVGDGSEKKVIESKINTIQLNDSQTIKMLGWVKDIARFNNGIDIICLSSDNEGTPVSLIEAQAGSIPVITTNVGGVEDILEKDKTGFIIEKGNCIDYAKKLVLLIENEKKRSEMSQNGWNYVHDKFSKETLARNTKKLYYELLEIPNNKKK
jgi:glycosyltransferase involved in cell wall biosynthesis